MKWCAVQIRLRCVSVLCLSVCSRPFEDKNKAKPSRLHSESCSARMWSSGLLAQHLISPAILLSLSDSCVFALAVMMSAAASLFSRWFWPRVAGNAAQKVRIKASADWMHVSVSVTENTYETLRIEDEISDAESVSVDRLKLCIVFCNSVPVAYKSLH